MGAQDRCQSVCARSLSVARHDAVAVSCRVQGVLDRLADADAAVRTQHRPLTRRWTPLAKGSKPTFSHIRPRCATAPASSPPGSGQDSNGEG